MQLPEPLIAQQFNRVRERLHDLVAGRCRVVGIFGPKGLGKTHLIGEVFAEYGKTSVRIGDNTLVGIRDLFLRASGRLFRFEDNDRWLRDVNMINLFKQVTEADGRVREAINANTLREGVRSITSHVRLVISSNTDLNRLPQTVRDHVEAVFDRGHLINISSEPLDRLAYLDWFVINRNYFHSATFRQETRLGRLMSLSEAQDVLNFLHIHAWRTPLSLRFLRDAAADRIRHPSDWQDKLITELATKALRSDVPPPAPRMERFNVRHGRPPAVLSGYERRQQKREQATASLTMVD